MKKKSQKQKHKNVISHRKKIRKKQKKHIFHIKAFISVFKFNANIQWRFNNPAKYFENLAFLLFITWINFNLQGFYPVSYTLY